VLSYTVLVGTAVLCSQKGCSYAPYSIWRLIAGSRQSQCQEAVEQFEDARVTVLQHKRAARKGRLNPQATSAPGHVIVAQGSATPESGCTLTNSRTDNRSVDLDGTVHKKYRFGI